MKVYLRKRNRRKQSTVALLEQFKLRHPNEEYEEVPQEEVDEKLKENERLSEILLVKMRELESLLEDNDELSESIDIVNLLKQNLNLM